MSTFYSTRSLLTRIRQKSADLRHIVQTALERNRKKYDLQLRQLKDTENREKFRIYGELINPDKDAAGERPAVFCEIQ